MCLSYRYIVSDHKTRFFLHFRICFVSAGATKITGMSNLIATVRRPKGEDKTERDEYCKSGEWNRDNPDYLVWVTRDSPISDDIWIHRGHPPSRQIDFLSHPWTEYEILSSCVMFVERRSKYKLKTIVPD